MADLRVRTAEADRKVAANNVVDERINERRRLLQGRSRSDDITADMALLPSDSDIYSAAGLMQEIKETFFD